MLSVTDMETHPDKAMVPEPEPTFGDLLHFLWARRVHLVSIFLVLAGLLPWDSSCGAS